MSEIKLQYIIPEYLNNKRLDKVLSALCKEHSRMRLQGWIKDGSVTVDGKILSQSDKVKSEQEIKVDATVSEVTKDQPQDIALDIIHEDDDIIVVNKPPGLVAHPAPGNRSNTMLNALLYRYPELAKVPRAGIIHRLDKDTSGLLVIVRTITAHTKLVADLKEHEIQREYEAVVCGVMTAGGTVDAPIKRHPKQRKQMAVMEDGRNAVTHYRVIKRFSHHTHIKVILETGRTHQIRVHMAHINYPIVGDKNYGGRLKIPAGASKKLRDTLIDFKRQALHARRLTLEHPTTGEVMTFSAPLPNDIQSLLTVLSTE